MFFYFNKINCVIYVNLLTKIDGIRVTSNPIETPVPSNLIRLKL